MGSRSSMWVFQELRRDRFNTSTGRSANLILRRLPGSVKNPFQFFHRFHCFFVPR